MLKATGHDVTQRGTQARELQALRLVCVRTLRRLALSGGSDRRLACSILQHSILHVRARRPMFAGRDFLELKTTAVSSSAGYPWKARTMQTNTDRPG